MAREAAASTGFITGVSCPPCWRPRRSAEGLVDLAFVDESIRLGEAASGSLEESGALASANYATGQGMNYARSAGPAGQ